MRFSTPWRLLIGGLVYALSGMAFGVGLVLFLTVAGVDVDAVDRFEFLVIGTLVTLPAILLAIWILARFIDRRHIADFGLGIDTRWWGDFVFGLALGAFLQMGIALVGLLAGWYQIRGFFVTDGSFVRVLLLMVLFFSSVGIVEELVVRGWLLTNLAEGLSRFGSRFAVGTAVVLSSILFGIAHMANPGASLISALIISLAGVFLAIGYVSTGELAIPIGIHVTWNAVQGGVFGWGVSGFELPGAVVPLEPVGPTWATGGSFGPEAGVLGFAAILLGIAAILFWVYWRTDGIGIHDSVWQPDLWIQRN